MAPPVRYARSGAVHIAHQLVGDGPDDLVYAWGMVSNLEMMWEDVRCVDFIQRLARFRRLLLFDRRGQGMSDRIASVASFEDHVDDVVAVMDAAGAARASIFGESNGVVAAIGCAALHPERVDRLVLFHGTAKMLADASQPWAVSEEVLEGYARWAEEWWGTGRVLRSIAPSGPIDTAEAEFAARYERQSHSPASFAAVLRAEAQWDVRPLLERITAPRSRRRVTGSCSSSTYRATPSRAPMPCWQPRHRSISRRGLACTPGSMSDAATTWGASRSPSRHGSARWRGRVKFSPRPPCGTSPSALRSTTTTVGPTRSRASLARGLSWP